jgi:hypothetical protein
MSLASYDGTTGASLGIRFDGACSAFSATSATFPMNSDGTGA